MITAIDTVETATIVRSIIGTTGTDYAEGFSVQFTFGFPVDPLNITKKQEIFLFEIIDILDNIPLFTFNSLTRNGVKERFCLVVMMFFRRIFLGGCGCSTSC